jgi:hypothetical protein
MGTFTGTGGADVLNGTAGDDFISGLGGDDALAGLGGNDTIDGGAGNDLITGGTGNDILTGGTGVDSFRDSAANLNGDRITDFLPGDRIQFTDLSLQSANLNIVGSTLTFSLPGSGTGSVQIDGLGPGRFVIRAINNNGGVEVRLEENAHNDFNGDGRSDILWRDSSGTIFNFLGTANGGFVNNGCNSSVTVCTTTQLVGIGDFNGDGLSDILWRSNSGAIFDFLGTANGGYVNNGDNSFVAVAGTTQIAGIGDFNGDGRSDILWRDSGGTIFDFLGTANGGYVNNGDNSSVTVGTSYQVASIGDFNGDAVDDILWRGSDGTIFNFLGKIDGGFANNGDNSFVSVATTTQVQDPFF